MSTILGDLDRGDARRLSCCVTSPGPALLSKLCSLVVLCFLLQVGAPLLGAPAAVRFQAEVFAHTRRLWCVQIFNVDGASLEQALLIRGHAGRVRAMAWHPCAPTLLTGSDDQTVRAWCLAGAAAGRGQEGTEMPSPPSNAVRPEAAGLQGESEARSSAAAAAVHAAAAHVAPSAACPGVAAAHTPLHMGNGGVGSGSSALATHAPRKASKGSRHTLSVQPLVRLEAHQV